MRSSRNGQASTRDKSTTSKKSLQHERVSEDPVPPLKHHRTDKDPYVEYWVAHKYQLPKEPIATNPVECWFARPKALRRAESSTSLYTQSESGSSKNRYNDKNFEIRPGCFRIYLSEGREAKRNGGHSNHRGVNRSIS